MRPIRIRTPDGLIVPDELVKCPDPEAQREGVATFFADHHLLQYATPLMKDIDYVVSQGWDFMPISMRYFSDAGLVQVVPGVRTMARSTPGRSLDMYGRTGSNSARRISGDTIINLPLQVETLVFCREEESALALAGLVSLRSDPSLYTAHRVGFFVD